MLTNLRNSFPNKPEKEIQVLAKKYYRYLCDMTLETFKVLTISEKQMMKRCTFSKESKQLFNKLAEEKQSAILVMGHLGNWEWAGSAFSLQFKQRLYVIYHPLSNKYFDGLIYKMRTRFGTGLYPMQTVFKDMLRNRKETNLTAFIADQTPSPENAHWMTFLNQDTPVFKGTEVISKKLNYPIVYTTVKKLKRGYYEISAETIVANPKNTEDGYITELHTKRLEKDIIQQPESWIWSHRRWKHERVVK